MTTTSRTILVLDAGGPGSMAALKTISRSAGLNVTTVACDMDRLSPAKLFSNHFIEVPAASSKEYIGIIRKIINDYKIDLVLPTFHFGFKELSNIGLPVFVTDFEKGLLCHDKYRFYKYCKKVDLPVPDTSLLRDVETITEPVYMKPRFGAGSKGHYLCKSEKELNALKIIIGDEVDYLVQEVIEGKFWSVELIIIDGEIVSMACFETLRVKAGNSSVVEVKDNPALLEFAKLTQERIGIKSTFVLQVFIDKNKKITIIEINPRHGSGIEFLAKANWNAPLYWSTNDTAYLGNPKKGIFHRYLDS